jgi:nucleoside-diphosphate-sugar epimerase
VILVTGAQGFLGRAVCAQQSSAIGTDLPCDITDRAAVDGIFRGQAFDAVIHLAGRLPSACRADPGLAARVNVMGSLNLIEAAVQARVRRFVFGSSISVYDPTDLYGAGKRYVEIVGETLAARGDLSFVALRIATVVGAGARRTASPWRAEIFEKLGTGRPQHIVIPFDAEAQLSLVHVEDVARMLNLLATRPDSPSMFYDSPAENWTAGALQQAIQALDSDVTVDLDSTSQKTPPTADGSRFTRDLAWQSRPLADRLAAARSAAIA